jgi:hypothetical protein
LNEHLSQWIESVSAPGWQWFVKYLAGNDTLLTKSHQAGPYIPKPYAFGLFPSLLRGGLNPRTALETNVDSHDQSAVTAVIWYNGGTRNECRVTGWGGKQSAVLDPESTGSLCIFAFYAPSAVRDAEGLRVWVCQTAAEEDEVLTHCGQVEPGGGVLFHPTGTPIPTADLAEVDSPCRLLPNQLPVEWRSKFPDAQSVVKFVISRVPTTKRNTPDDRLLRRRECEYDVFRSVEETLVLPRIKEGFATVDLFVDFANAVTNRRKARSGASLELHARLIFDEEKVAYSHGATSEAKKKPDFLFPSAEAYQKATYPSEKLRMLAAKTTCKDRWRQILNEADRVRTKHLLTLQEGVSENQLEEMRRAGVRLVVPSKLHSRFPATYRDKIMTFSDFIADVQSL